MTVTLRKRELISQHRFDKICCTLYLFVLVFAPPIIPYPHLVLTIFSFLSLMTTYKNRAIFVAKKSGIYQWVFIMVLLAVYTICVPLTISMLCNDIVNLSHYISIVNRYGVLVVAESVCVTYLLCVYSKKKYDWHFLLECLINAGIIEGICAILAFLSPNIKSIFIFFMKRFSESYLYSNTWYITVRSYGFASTLVDVFGLGIGIIAGISFFYGISKSPRYVFYSLIIAVATLLNSRTGLIIYMFAIILSILVVLRKKNLRSLRRMCLMLLFFGILGIAALKIMETNEYTAGWFKSGINSIANFFSENKDVNNSNDAMSLLFQANFWKLPDFPRIIIGTGHSLYGAEGYEHSDVGYVNELWLFGVIGCTILYGMIAKMCFTLCKRAHDSTIKFSGLFLMISYFFFNIKGAALGYNPGAVAMFFLIFVGRFQLLKE